MPGLTTEPALTPVTAKVLPPADPEHPETYTPTNPERITLHFNPGFHSSYATSAVSLPPNTVFLPITTATPAEPNWATVQTGRDSHILLNSDLLYCNHSCKPSLVFDMEKMETRTTERGLKEGDILTFFYPSTEWSMKQGFECQCGEEGCLGKVEGTEKISAERLKEGGWWLNKHIRELIAERDGTSA